MLFDGLHHFPICCKPSAGNRPDYLKYFLQFRINLEWYKKCKYSSFTSLFLLVLSVLQSFFVLFSSLLFRPSFTLFLLSLLLVPLCCVPPSSVSLPECCVCVRVCVKCVNISRVSGSHLMLWRRISAPHEIQPLLPEITPDPLLSTSYIHLHFQIQAASVALPSQKYPRGGGPEYPPPSPPSSR